jgi:uncharacterized membrane protein
MAVQAVGGRVGESARNLAYMNYALLFSAVFFAGVPALIAAVIAYSQKDEAPPTISSHFAFQLRIFWIAFVIALTAGLCFLGAMINVAGELFQVTRIEGWNVPDRVRVDLSDVTVDRTLIALVAGTGLFSAIGGVWLVFAPALGFIRLASGRGMGHSAHS